MKISFLPFAFFMMFLCCSDVTSQTITTIAGTGFPGYNGDGIAATIAHLNTPAGVTIDKEGNVLIADFLNHRVRKIGATGFISTIAGTGMAGYNGDNIPATAARLFRPEALSVDTAGNIFIEDTYNHLIRKINRNGIITTVAGNGYGGYNGDNILATQASLHYPSDGVLVDTSGNIYIADSYNNRIRMVNTNGIITTIAGIGIPGYNGDGMAATNAAIYYPYALALDEEGCLYFADGRNHRIRKINKNGIISTIAGTGTAGYNGDNIPAGSASLNTPQGIAFDPAGNLYISDSYNQRIRKVNKYTGIITTVVGTGADGYNGDNIPAIMAQVNNPVAIAFDRLGHLYIADLTNNRIRKVTGLEIILPLSLKKFTADLRSNQAFLQWVTDQEKNVRRFVVEYSNDGVKFSYLGMVDGKNIAGLNSYSFVHGGLEPGSYYYRLKMVDHDGTFTYSQIANLKVKSSSALLLSVYPNPVISHLNLSFLSSANNPFVISVTDISGKMIKKISGRSLQGLNKQLIDLHALSRGAYLITIVNGENEVETVKFFKQ